MCGRGSLLLIVLTTAPGVCKSFTPLMRRNSVLDHSGKGGADSGLGESSSQESVATAADSNDVELHGQAFEPLSAEDVRSLISRRSFQEPGSTVGTTPAVDTPDLSIKCTGYLSKATCTSQFLHPCVWYPHSQVCLAESDLQAVDIGGAQSAEEVVGDGIEFYRPQYVTTQRFDIIIDVPAPTPAPAGNGSDGSNASSSSSFYDSSSGSDTTAAPDSSDSSNSSNATTTMTTTTTTTMPPVWEPCSGDVNGFVSCWDPFGDGTTNSRAMKGTLTGATQSIAMEIILKRDNVVGAEFFVYCGSPTYGGGVSSTFAPQNAALRVWYNHAELPFTLGGCPIDDGTSNAQWAELTVNAQIEQNLTIPVTATDAHPIIRVEMSRTDDTQAGTAHTTDATAYIMVRVQPTSSASFIKEYDQCMDNVGNGSGQCISALAGTNVPLRSNQSLQLDCISGDAQRASDLGDKCVAWRTCLQGQNGRNVLLNVLKGISLKPTGTYAERTDGCIADTDHRTCLDLSSIDVASINCGCLYLVNGKNETEIHDLACARTDVCCDWKSNHCPTTSLLLEARRSGTVNTKHSLVSAGKTGALDGAVSTKCSGA